MGRWKLGYNFHTVNSHCLGSGEPVRVKEGQRVLFRIVNASATESHRLALAGHKITVTRWMAIAVPTPRSVEAIELAPAERADVVVEMNNPGVWVFGDADDKMRQSGLGVVIEYAGRTGPPQMDGAFGGGLGLHGVRARRRGNRARCARSAGVQAQMDGKPLGGSLARSTARSFRKPIPSV